MFDDTRKRLPSAFGSRLGMTIHYVYGPAVDDPAGSVSVIDVPSRSVVATAGFNGVPTSGARLRTATGTDFEPEYIAVDDGGTMAFVTLREPTPWP